MPDPRTPARSAMHPPGRTVQRQWPLRRHLALFAAMLIAPAVIFTGFLIKQFVEDREREAVSRIVQLTNDLNDDISNELERSFTVLRALSIPLSSSSPELSLKRDEAIHVISGPHQTLRVYDAAGKFLSTSAYGEAAADYDNAAALNRVVATKEPLLTGLTGSPQSGYRVDMLYPAIREESVLRVLVLSYSPDRFRRVLETQFLTSAWTTGISDANGVLIARSRLHGEYLGKRLTPELLEMSKPNTAPHRIASVDGRPIIRAVARARNSGWIISASVTQDYIDGTVRRAVFGLVGLGVGLLALSTILVGAYANRLVAAFRDLGHGSTEAESVRQTMVLEANEASLSLKHMLDELRYSRNALQTTLDVSGIVTWGWDDRRQLKLWTPAGKRLFGVEPDREITRELFMSLLHPADVPRYEKAWTAALDPLGSRRYELEYRITRPSDRAERWIKSAAVVEFEGERPVRLIGAALDITDQKTREQHVNTLLREVNHRSKNLLAVVLAVARQTTAANTDEFVERFAQRIQALSASQDLLVQSSWRGVDLASLIRAQLGHLGTPDDSQITIAGPPLKLSSSAAQTLGMAVHELATNAAKYGALSSSTGAVAIGWKVDSRMGRFSLTWTESGGPPVAQPKRLGFGTNVLTHICRAGLTGEVELRFDEAGVSWSLACPLDCVRDRGSTAIDESTAPVS